MSSKVVEANAGIHSLAMAVAVRVLVPLPVRLYTDRLRIARYKLEALWSVPFSRQRTAFSLLAQEGAMFLISSLQIQCTPSGIWTLRRTIRVDT